MNAANKVRLTDRLISDTFVSVHLRLSSKIFIDSAPYNPARSIAQKILQTTQERQKKDYSEKNKINTDKFK